MGVDGQAKDGAPGPSRQTAPVSTPKKKAAPGGTTVDGAYARPENEDDDGYDPWSDRRPEPEPLFERDPWA